MVEWWFVLADYYERLVQEYLELNEFLVRLNVKFKKTKGRPPSDIDIIAVNARENQYIVGEESVEEMRSKFIEKLLQYESLKNECNEK